MACVYLWHIRCTDYFFLRLYIECCMHAGETSKRCYVYSYFWHLSNLTFETQTVLHPLRSTHLLYIQPKRMLLDVPPRWLRQPLTFSIRFEDLLPLLLILCSVDEITRLGRKKQTQNREKRFEGRDFGMKDDFFSALVFSVWKRW